MGKMRRSRSFKKEQENNVINIDEAREQRREKRRLEKEKREEKLPLMHKYFDSKASERVYKIMKGLK